MGARELPAGDAARLARLVHEVVEAQVFRHMAACGEPLEQKELPGCRTALPAAPAGVPFVDRSGGKPSSQATL
jgi:hypothetical protein